MRLVFQDWKAVVTNDLSTIIGIIQCEPIAGVTQYTVHNTPTSCSFLFQVIAKNEPEQHQVQWKQDLM